MVLGVVALKSLKYLPWGGIEHSVKSCNKFLKLFPSRFQSKFFSEYSAEKNTDVFDMIQIQKYLNFLLSENSPSSCQSPEQVARLLKEKMNVEEEMKALENMPSEGDKELEKLIQLEKKKNLEKIQQINNNLCLSLILSYDEHDCRDVELRVEQRIGGEESRLFSEELLRMYVNYANYKNWEVVTEGCCAFISGELVFGHLKYEAGVHRVQRVPETEKSGRTHTSTCSVLVLPQPKSHEIQINNKDLIVQKTKSSGPGGQNVNKRETCIRIKHIPTGIVVENQTERYQNANLKVAINKLRSILFNMELEKQAKEKRALRKEQVGMDDYTDKIRTYNYTQNRITDHRINYTTHHIMGFLEGNKELDFVISKVRESVKKKEFLLNVENILQSKEYKNFEKQQSN